MSEFLMVVPDGWNEVPGDINELFALYGGEAAVLDAQSQSHNNMDTVIEPVGLPPPGMTVMDCRIFKDGGVSRMWVKYGPTGN